MNKKSYKKIKNKPDISVKLLKQLFFSVALFLTVILLSEISVPFKETVRIYTKKNTDFKACYKYAYEKIEQCFKEYSEAVDLE